MTTATPTAAPTVPGAPALDPATAGVTENTYIEIDEETAVGIPEAATA